MDQFFSVQSSLISRHTFDNPGQVVDLLDSASRPDNPGERERKLHKSQTMRVRASAYKLDAVARWQDWVSVLGLRIKGLRAWKHRVKVFLLFGLCWQSAQQQKVVSVWLEF